jgi:endonuclease/exonuclease/phosphatase (EEP) superfamily protein YafD
MFLGVGALSLKMKKEAIAGLAFFLLSGIGLVKYYVPIDKVDSVADIKILSINLLSSNNNSDEVLDFIINEDPDLIVLQEVNQKWDTYLSSLGSTFPFKLTEIREDNFGLVVLSKVELIDPEKIILSNSGVPSFYFKINMDSKETHFIATHPLPPIGTDYFDYRNEQFTNLNKMVKRLNGSKVLIGDLNTTSFSPNFNRIIEGTSLRDSRLGFGLQPSWNAQIPFISVTIDHILISKEIMVTNRMVGPDIGSDHFPVIIKIGS